MTKIFTGFVVFLGLTAQAFGVLDKRAESVSKHLVKLSGEFNEAWNGAETFFLFTGSPMSCKDSVTTLGKAVECQLAATQLAIYPENRNPFGIFFDKVILATGVQNRQKLVELVLIGTTERTPGFPDGLEVRFTLRHFEGFPKRQWGTFEIPEWDISRKLRAKLK